MARAVVACNWRRRLLVPELESVSGLVVQKPKRVDEQTEGVSGHLMQVSNVSLMQSGLSLALSKNMPGSKVLSVEMQSVSVLNIIPLSTMGSEKRKRKKGSEGKKNVA
jgi:hypothetical protein